MQRIERLSTGIYEVDDLLSGGIPKGFFVVAVGEPGTGKTIFSLHFISAGLQDGEPGVYVTTEESRNSIVRQAEMFNLEFYRYLKQGQLIIIDIFSNDQWRLSSLDIKELIERVIEAKKKLGYGDARLVIDSISAFWLSSPGMARKYAYRIKQALYKWRFTTLVTSQYAITTNSTFGFGVEHIADGIIRFKKKIVNNRLRRYILIEKMRQTPHDMRLHEIDILDGVGLIVVEAAEEARVREKSWA